VTDDDRIEQEILAVMEIIREDFPDAEDYTATDNDTFNILDKNDEVIATVSERQMTRYWNLMEGGILMDFHEFNKYMTGRTNGT
jgi:hypothetical protein